MAQERATGKDVILAIAENMQASLEPLVTKTLAPSLYQIYLHRDDYDHLRTIFPELEAESKRLLDGELARLNRATVQPIDRLLSPLRRRAAKAVKSTTAANAVKENDEGGPRFVSAEGRWTIRFQEDPNGTLEPGEIEVVSEFAQDPSRSYGGGSPTHRISTTRRLGAMSSRRETVAGADALARFTYQDQGGSRTFLMTKDEIVIGREAADVWVDLRLETSLDVSREHARVQRSAASGGFRIKDLSKLGTTVDGKPLPQSLESAGGEVRDLDRWTDLPDRARIGLAGVVFLDFERLK